MRNGCILLLLFWALPLCGCFESHQEYTIEQNGSGFVMLRAIFEPDSSELRESVDQFLADASSVQSWSELKYERRPDGRVSLAAKAQFRDVASFDLPPYVTRVTLKKMDSRMVLEVLPDKMEEEEELREDAGNLESRIREARSNWERSRPAIIALLGALKKEAIFHLPGKVETVRNMVRVNDSTVSIQLNGFRLIEAIDALMKDDNWLRAQIKAGRSGPALDEAVYEKLYGEKGSPQTVFIIP